MTLAECGSPCVITQAAPRCFTSVGQTVGEGKQLGDPGCVGRQRVPSRLGERATRPRLVELPEPRFDVPAAG